MCWPYRIVHLQGQGRKTNWLYVCYHDWSAISWLEITKLPVFGMALKEHKSNTWKKQPYFDKTPATAGTLKDSTWFCRFQCRWLQTNVKTLWDTYRVKLKPTTVKNPHLNTILEWVHQTIIWMISRAEIDMAQTLSETDITDFLTNATWAIHSTPMLGAFGGIASFRRDMLRDVSCVK